MRTNLYPLEHPAVFKQTDMGKFTFNKDNIQYVKNQARMTMIKNPKTVSIVDNRYVPDPPSKQDTMTQSQPNLLTTVHGHRETYEFSEEDQEKMILKRKQEMEKQAAAELDDQGFDETMKPKASKPPSHRNSSSMQQQRGFSNNRLKTVDYDNKVENTIQSLRRKQSEMSKSTPKFLLNTLLKEADPVFERQETQLKRSKFF